MRDASSSGYVSREGGVGQDLFMETEVIAALIAAPAALFTAWAAYGAGRVQGRGAVDSVRRQSQRDSYAQLIAVCYEFNDQALRAWPPTAHAAVQEETEELGVLERRIGERTSFVTLDGPPHVAHLAYKVWEAASHVRLDAALNRPSVERRAHSALSFDVALTAFVNGASAHLNTGLLPRWRRR
ncbi:hypothetical protein GCM10010306_099050 [Streptomyces umbrinus]|uniref:hypothetical protein n=1 Tax=Streptomyces umbrinus TaxID=67370 RepID=UPI001674C8A7|nr:hypothetical protein [Streptomyces umbrinus]GHB88258.1 hypothetical protein GCM10010306_099050 [Streptomyces umbrinus]